MPSLVRSLSHNSGLDALRGIAITLVFLFHAGIQGFSGAFIGVDIFFVLSGFLITLLLLQEHQTKGKISLRKFYIRRMLRLLPGLMLMLLTYLAYVNFHVGDSTVKLHELQDALIALFYAANWTRAFDLNRPDILGHTWSLSAEEQFYIIWPLFIRFLLPLSGLLRSLIIALLFFLSWAWRAYLLSHGASWNRLYNGLDCRADMLLAGCLLASLWNTGYLDFWPNSKLFSRIFVFISFIVLAVMSNTVDWQKAPLYLWQYPLVALGTAIIILEIVSLPGGFVNKTLNRKWLVLAGKISYGIYLWHYPVISQLKEIRVSTKLQPIVAALLTVFFAVISWYGIERPCLKLKHRFK